jgi:hypothetical protein
MSYIYIYLLYYKACRSTLGKHGDSIVLLLYIIPAVVTGFPEKGREGGDMYVLSILYICCRPFVNAVNCVYVYYIYIPHPLSTPASFPPFYIRYHHHHHQQPRSSVTGAGKAVSEVKRSVSEVKRSVSEVKRSEMPPLNEGRRKEGREHGADRGGKGREGKGRKGR